MSRLLYLMRHAQSADKQPGQADNERELTLKGMQDATQIGRHLYSEKIIPKFILSSTAIRAKTTAQLVSDVWKYETEKIQLEEELYEASVRTFLQLVKQLDDSIDSIMCVGHNPAISYLAEYLTKAEIGDMSPGSLVIIQFQTKSWNDSNEGTGALTTFITPENLSDDK
jgi:phosphohistidine phosphatase